MRKLSIRIIVALLTFIIGITATAVWFINRSSIENLTQRKDITPVAQKKQELRVMIPNENWVPIFFEAIDERAGIAKLPKLKTINLPKDDLEVRVWAGFGLTALEGFVLKRTNGQWSAIHLEGIHARLPRSEYQKQLQTPKSGWDAFWHRLVNAGILTLPDASEVKCNTYINDGMSYVVEVNANNTYRTYLYDNPDYAKCREAKQMIGIIKIIGEEFSLQKFNIKE
jgi:hypothetical protein